MAGYNAGTSRFTSVTTGMVVGTAIGNTGGVQAVTLTTAQMPAHTHSVPVEGSGSNDGIDIINAGNDGSVTTGATGGGGAHSNIPPVIMLNYVIKT
jgi:microcystin-dependent protein